MKRELPEGARIKFGHGRRVDGDWGTFFRRKDGRWGCWDPEHTTNGHRTYSSKEISPQGGMTFCTITLTDGTEAHGRAECSVRDNYSKRIGRDIALGRALVNLERRTQ